MDKRFRLVTGKTRIDGQEKETYGIELVNGGAVGCRQIPDISTDKKKICHWIALMNALDLSELHFQDVVEDILVGE